MIVKVFFSFCAVITSIYHSTSFSGIHSDKGVLIPSIILLLNIVIVNFVPSPCFESA